MSDRPAPTTRPKTPAEKLQAEGHVSTEVQALVEPDEALAGATF